jgi:Domain of unknown function (DUF4388)
VSPKELEDSVRTQTEDAVFDLLRWERGQFLWEQGDGIDVEIPIAVSVENLIMEASRRLDELDVMRRKIPSAETLVTMAAKPPEGAVEINITPDEWRVLVLVNGSRTVGDIASAAGLDEFDATRTLYGLVSAGLLEVISNSAGGSDVDERHSAIHPEAESRPGAEIQVSSPDVDATAPLEEPVGTAAVPEGAAAAAGREDLYGGAETTGAPADEEPVVRLEDLAPDRRAEGESVPEAWFGDPVTVSSEGDVPMAAGEAEAAPEAAFEPDVARGGNGSVEAEPAAPASVEQVEGAPPSEQEPAVEPPAPPAAGETGAGGGVPRLDRSAVVRELAGLFSEGEPAPPARQEPPPSPTEPDERKRVEDDDQVTKGLISRLIDGVKGL